MAQMSAIELHPWGTPEADPTRPDHLVFDLDPGEGVPFADVVAAAHEVRDRLSKLNLTSFCRTTGGKGLHVVVPLRRDAGWDRAKPFCRAFAEMMAQDAPKRFLAHTKIADRRGRILVDWLRNGLGATAVRQTQPVRSLPKSLSCDAGARSRMRRRLKACPSPKHTSTPTKAARYPTAAGLSQSAPSCRPLHW